MARFLICLIVATLVVVQTVTAFENCISAFASLPATVCKDDLSGYFTCTLNAIVFPPINEMITDCPENTRCSCGLNAKCSSPNPCAPFTPVEPLPDSFTLRYHGTSETKAPGESLRSEHMQGLWYQDGPGQRMIINSWIGGTWFFELFLPNGDGTFTMYKGNYANPGKSPPVAALCLPPLPVDELPTLQNKMKLFTQTFNSAQRRVYELNDGRISPIQPKTTKTYVIVSDDRGFNRPESFRETFMGAAVFPFFSQVRWSVGLFENKVDPYSSAWFRIPPHCR